MDQGVTATFMELVEVLNRSEIFIRIIGLKGINNTDTAWEEMSVNCVNGE